MAFKALQLLFPVSPYSRFTFRYDLTISLHSLLVWIAHTLSLSLSLPLFHSPALSIHLWAFDLGMRSFSNTLSSYPKASLFNPSFSFALAVLRVQVLVEDGSVHHPEVIVCSGIQRAASKYCNKQQDSLVKDGMHQRDVTRACAYSHKCSHARIHWPRRKFIMH